MQRAYTRSEVVKQLYLAYDKIVEYEADGVPVAAEVNSAIDMALNYLTIEEGT